MIVPVQITFRNMPPSDAVAARVQEEAEKLDEFYRRTMIASGVDANGIRCVAEIFELYKRPSVNKII